MALLGLIIYLLLEAFKFSWTHDPSEDNKGLKVVNFSCYFCLNEAVGEFPYFSTFTTKTHVNIIQVIPTEVQHTAKISFVNFKQNFASNVSTLRRR